MSPKVATKKRPKSVWEAAVLESALKFPFARKAGSLGWSIAFHFPHSSTDIRTHLFTRALKGESPCAANLLSGRGATSEMLQSPANVGAGYFLVSGNMDF